VSDSGLPCSACRDDEFSLLRESDGFDRATLQRSASSPGGSFQLDWQVPRAPVRFPLRDAILSVQEQDAEAGMSSVSSKGPLKVRMTDKARDLKYLSHRKRHNLDPPALGEIHAQPLPRPPPDVTARKPAKKALNSYGTDLRVQARRNAEDAAWSTWIPQEEPVEVAPPSALRHPPVEGIRGTLTSSARAVLSHSRRFAVDSLAVQPSSTHGSHGSHGAKKPSQDPMAAWSPARQSRGLPKPVKEWVCRGLEFTDAGLGIGDRFDVDLQRCADRAPGHIYNQDFGNIARYKSESSMPTKQPAGSFVSCETHKMGARRDTTTKRDRQRPGPGTYELMGFAQELVHKLGKRPKGEGPQSLSPPSSPKGTMSLQAL